VLRLLAAGGMVSPGLLSLDGAKLAGSAAQKGAGRCRRPGKILAEAAAADAAGDARPGGKLDEPAPRTHRRVPLGSGCATDVTGFGLLGHLFKLARASGVSAVVDRAAVPLIDGTRAAVRAGHVPGGSRRNLDWVLPHTDAGTVGEEDLLLLADAQTSGGLLVAGELPGAPVIGELVRRATACSSSASPASAHRRGRQRRPWLGAAPGTLATGRRATATVRAVPCRARCRPARRNQWAWMALFCPRASPGRAARIVRHSQVWSLWLAAEPCDRGLLGRTRLRRPLSGRRRRAGQD
jgi:hypothetical protein